MRITNGLPFETNYMKRSVQRKKHNGLHPSCRGDAGVAVWLKWRYMATTFAALVTAFCSLYDRGLLTYVLERLPTL